MITYLDFPEDSAVDKSLSLESKIIMSQKL